MKRADWLITINLLLPLCGTVWYMHNRGSQQQKPAFASARWPKRTAPPTTTQKNL